MKHGCLIALLVTITILYVMECLLWDLDTWLKETLFSCVFINFFDVHITLYEDISNKNPIFFLMVLYFFFIDSFLSLNKNTIKLKVKFVKKNRLKFSKPYLFF